MTGQRTAVLVLACGSALFPWSASGWGEETGSTLELGAASAHRSVARGAPLAFNLTLRNAGPGPLELYHPDSIHRMSPCWSLTGTVTRPGGDTVTLAPEITFTNVSVERREDFQHLSPGDAITVEIRLQADDRSATHTPYRLGDAGRRGPRWSVALAEMVHDTLDDRRVGEEADNSHFASISGTHQRIYLVHSPDQLGPAASRRCALRRRRDRLLKLG